jgi:hypothetical protein
VIRLRLKREVIGVNPTRSRHCNSGAESHFATDRFGLGRRLSGDEAEARKPASSENTVRTYGR